MKIVVNTQQIFNLNLSVYDSFVLNSDLNIRSTNELRNVLKATLLRCFYFIVQAIGVLNVAHHYDHAKCSRKAYGRFKLGNRLEGLVESFNKTSNTEISKFKKFAHFHLLLLSFKNNAAGRFQFLSDKKIFPVDAKVSRKNEYFFVRKAEDGQIVVKIKSLDFSCPKCGIE